MQYLIRFIPVFVLLLTGSKAISAQSTLEDTLSGITDYHIAGSGPDTLLLLPCMSCRWNEWETFMQRNQERYTMYAVTVPGFGGTLVPDLTTGNYHVPIWRNNLMKALSNFIDQHHIKGAIVVGHSWGTQLAIQLAATRPDVFTKVIAVDGGIESTSMIPEDETERIRKIKSIEEYGRSLAADPGAWRNFNKVTYQYRDTIRKEDVEWALKLHGSFMATSKVALIQYWRENLIVDLDAYLHRLNIPILNIQSFIGKNQQEQKRKHLAELRAVGNPKHVKTVILYDTYHFIMQHRPAILDHCIKAFINDQELEEEFRF